MKSNIRLTATGIIGGQLWMGGLGWASFSKTFFRGPKKPFTDHIESVRDMYAAIIECGDFRDTQLVSGTLLLTYTDGRRTISKRYDLRDTKECAEFVCSEEMWDEVMNADFYE